MTQEIGARIPKLLLPKPGIDLRKWAVIACDQFTSEPDYWHQVAALVGAAPSTYHITLPEVFLGTSQEEQRIASIRTTMASYLRDGAFIEHEGIVLVERTAAGRTRHGIMLALDLEQYDFRRGSTSLIRATEGTILERIPPRVRIRSGAPLELPHILVLIDDPQRTVIEPLVAARGQMQTMYDLDLMLGSGHLTGSALNRGHEQDVLDALAKLADPAAFARKYDRPAGSPPLLFAVGDGNHSLATAKTIWEQVKAEAGPDHPARYALVEVENIHDEGLIFEPIHRVLFDVKGDFLQAFEIFTPETNFVVPCATAETMISLVESQAVRERRTHAMGVVTAQGFNVAYVPQPQSNLAVGTLQAFLDVWGQTGNYAKLDYVHGADVAIHLGSQPGNIGLYLPSICKDDFFRTVILDGVLPRKTFSMGEALEKRFYMEARRIA